MIYETRCSKETTGLAPHFVAPHLRWSSGIQMPLRSVAGWKRWKLLGFIWLFGLNSHNTPQRFWRGSHMVPPRSQWKNMLMTVDVCFECVLLGWQLVVGVA